MDRERELKFSLLDAPPGDEELEAALQGSGFSLRPRGLRRQRDTYFDTPDGALRAAGVALRQREHGEVRLGTLKTLGRVRGPYHERDELEVPLLPGGAWGEELLAAAEGLASFDRRRLAPVMTVHTERHAYGVYHQSVPLAELCFDAVSARSPGTEREALFREAELEAAVGASLALLEAFVEHLQRCIALTPSGVTKLQRAEALLTLGAALE